MSTAASLLSARIAAKLIATAVATQAGVTPSTWASVMAPRVFRGIGANAAGKNRGRLPFMEYDITGSPFEHVTVEGGTVTLRVRIVAHCAGRDSAVASELLYAILSASLASIRDESTDNYTALGSDNIGETQQGPWGHSREATMDVELTFARSDYGVG